MRRALGLGLLLLSGAALAQFAPQSAGTPPLDPQLEVRVQALGKNLRCTVCQGMSIADSPSSMARAQLDQVRTMVKEGHSDADIKQFFVERYGEWALMEPRRSGTNWFLWLLPVGLLAGGLAFIVLYAVGTSRGDSKPPPSTVPPEAEAGAAPKAEDPYLSAVRAELDQ